MCRYTNGTLKRKYLLEFKQQIDSINISNIVRDGVFHLSLYVPHWNVRLRRSPASARFTPDPRVAHTACKALSCNSNSTPNVRTSGPQWHIGRLLSPTNSKTIPHQDASVMTSYKSFTPFYHTWNLRTLLCAPTIMRPNGWWPWTNPGASPVQKLIII